MGRYLARRLAAALLILLGVTAVTFALSYIIPADPVRMIAGRSATPETVESIRQQLGLDRPVWEQYGSYALQLAQGDLGRSYVQKTEVATLIWSRPMEAVGLSVAVAMGDLLDRLGMGGSVVMRVLSGVRPGLSISKKQGLE